MCHPPVFDKLQAEEIKESKKYELFRSLGDLKDEITQLEKLEESDLVASFEKLSKLLEDPDFE